MASNFRVSIDRSSPNIRLRLMGDFDGTSACELLNALKEKCRGTDAVVIDTDGLKKIHRFGQDTFRNNLYQLKSHSISCAFTGINASRIAPERRAAP